MTRLKCPSWQQLEAIYERDIRRGALTLRSPNPPAIGTRVSIELVLPSGTALTLTGLVTMHHRKGPAMTRLEVQLQFAAGDLWIIESGIAAARRAREALTKLDPPLGDYEVEIEIEEDVDTGTAEHELAGALERELETLRGKPPQQILGVAVDASPEMAREAFQELSKKYHPDAFARFTSMKIWSLAGELFILVSDAYSALAEQAASRASARLSRREDSAAEVLLDQDRLDEAMEAYEAILRKDPKNRKARIGLEIARGLSWIRDGANPAAAAEQFARILEADPQNARAQAVLARLMRSLTDDSRKRLAKMMKEDK